MKSLLTPINKGYETYLTSLQEAANLVQTAQLSSDERTRLKGLQTNLFSSAYRSLLDGKRQEILAGILSFQIPALLSLENRLLVSAELEDKGAKRTPDNWYDYYSKLTDGGIMASAGDFYQCWKQLKQDVEQGNLEQKTKAQEIIVSFREDFDWRGKSNYLVAGTRLEYNPGDLEAAIIQHYKARNSALVKTTSLEIPEYLDVPIAKVASEDKGLKYLQTVFDTEDNAETIIETLEFISNKRRDQIKIWIAPLESNQYYTRKKYPNRAVGFNYYSDYFRINGDDFNDRGRSRRVDVGAPAGRAL